MVGPAPRLFGITATESDVVAVLRRGPSGWTHVGRWDTAADSYQPGGWLRGRIYPQRCDVSPDGRYLCYFALKDGRADWALGRIFIAVSKLPWLTALAAWGCDSTYERGWQFVPDPARWDANPPQAGGRPPREYPYGVDSAVTADVPVSFAVERRRGWTETPDCPPRVPGDTWDQRRAGMIRIGRRQPAGSVWLVASGGFAAFREGSGPGRTPYELRDGAGGQVLRRLDEAQWADWAHDGRLLVATTDGRLQSRHRETLDVLWEQDLAPLRPDPQPAPAAAGAW